MGTVNVAVCFVGSLAFCYLGALVAAKAWFAVKLDYQRRLMSGDFNKGKAHGK
jgi:hypothetical protein